MELCTNGLKHEFKNSWGSFRQFNYVGLCKCTRSAHPIELAKAYVENQCDLEDILLKQLIKHGYLIHDNYWLCHSCKEVFTQDIDRISHFKQEHNFY